MHTNLVHFILNMKTKPFTSCVTFLLSLMVVTFVLTACSDSDDDVKINPGLPERTYPLDWKITNEDRPRVVMDGLLDNMFRSEFDQIIFEYNSVGPDLKTPVRLTGTINMPHKVFTKEMDPRHLTILTQWTHAKSVERFSLEGKEEMSLLMNGAQGVIAISSDLYGWTLTNDKAQAYCCPEITAVETLDCWDAAIEILKSKGYKIDGLPISNIGYSSAGMQAIGIQRFIDEHRPDIQVAFTGVGSSPYDINAVWQHYVETNYTGYVCSFPLIMVAYNETYQMGINYKDILKEPLCNHIQDWILDKKYYTSDINNFIGNEKKVDEILTPVACDWTKGVGKVMYDKFKENSLCDASSTWQPSKKTQFYVMHSTKDSYMDWHVSEKMANFLKARGCKVQTDFADYGDHNNYGGVIFAINTLMLLETYDNQEDSKEVVEMVQTLAQMIQSDPELQSMLTK